MTKRLPFPSEAEVLEAIRIYDFDKIRAWVRRQPIIDKDRELMDMLVEMWQER